MYLSNYVRVPHLLKISTRNQCKLFFKICFGKKYYIAFCSILHLFLELDQRNLYTFAIDQSIDLHLLPGYFDLISWTFALNTLYKKDL